MIADVWDNQIFLLLTGRRLIGLWGSLGEWAWIFRDAREEQGNVRQTKDGHKDAQNVSESRESLFISIVNIFTNERH